MERYGRHADLSQGDACGARSPTACEGIVTTLARIPFMNAQAHTRALAHAPTEPDRDALARCLQTQAGRGEVAHALADARRRIARGD